MKVDRVIEHIVNWMTDYCEKAGADGFVVGVSGGIDSAVTSTLCAKTGKTVFALNMPIFQDPGQFSLAKLHMETLARRFPNVHPVTVDLSEAFTALQNCLPPEVCDDHSMANTRSRLRMVTLYVFATHHGMLVAGTGNKVEDFGVGFYTKYGDGGVDISPIADLLKTEVYELGQHLGVDEKIIKAPPTDGLWPDNRTDEKQIGATYRELEWAMNFDAAHGDEEKLTQRQKEVLEIYRRFNRANRHKMEPIPVCTIPGHLR
ncbi:MAG: NAD(+) synthase [Desulfococcus sp. 4484_241]|nr:MAG: NAD(+) synthase [Desulfococcus sp. 4484_241]